MKRLKYLPNYSHSILNISASILNYYGVKSEYPTLDILDKKLNENYNHVIFMVLDGLGLNIIKENLPKGALLRKNIKKKLTSVFPPTTVAATTAMLSGKAPISSGYLGWTQYNKIDDAITTVFGNIDYYNSNRILTHNLQEDSLKYLDIATQIKEKNKDLHTEVIFPAFREGGFDSFNEQLTRLLTITKMPKSFSYCYWNEPDLTIHGHGISGNATKEVVNNLNTSYERFINDLDDDVLVITTADHGLIDVLEIPIYN